jgi:translation elongation factor EF-G
LEGKTDCRRETKGTIRIKITPAAKEKFPEICEGIREVNRKYPCVKISVNGKNIGGSP